MHALIQKVPLLARFARCRSGTAAIEFAFAIPALLLVTAGLIEVAMILFAITLAEGGLREGARYGLTGQSPASGTREDQILQIVQQHTHGLVDAAAADLEIVTYPGFDNVQEAEDYDDANTNGQYDAGETYDDANSNGEYDAGNGTPGAGGSGQVVVYTLTFQWEFLTPVFEVFGGPDGNLELSASIAVRNEPF
jgi:Flp pilus assembly protein TadG